MLIRLDTAHLSDLDKVGKTASMISSGMRNGIPFLPGVVVSSEVYETTFQENHLFEKIKALLETVNPSYPDHASSVEKKIRALIKNARLSQEAKTGIEELFFELAGVVNFPKVLITPSSHFVNFYNPATELELTVDSPQTFVEVIKNCWAQNFTRSQNLGTPVIIQKLPRVKTSGTFRTGCKQKSKTSKLLPLELSVIAQRIHNHFYFPHEVGWILAEDGKIYVKSFLPVREDRVKVVARQESKANGRDSSNKNSRPGRIATGLVQKVLESKGDSKRKRGRVLVTRTLPVDFALQVEAIIMEEDDCDPKLKFRLEESGIPVVFGVRNATTLLNDGMSVTVHSGTGEIYKGNKITRENLVVKSDNRKYSNFH